MSARISQYWFMANSLAYLDFRLDESLADDPVLYELLSQ